MLIIIRIQLSSKIICRCQGNKMDPLPLPVKTGARLGAISRHPHPLVVRVLSCASKSVALA